MDFEELKKQVPLELFEQIQMLSFEAEVKDKVKDPETQTQKCLERIKHLQLKEKLEEISRRIKQAEEKKDFKTTEVLTREFNELSKNLKT